MDHAREIKAWSYERRTAAKVHTCRICGGLILIGSPYIDVALADNVTPSSEKLSHKAEHLGCNMPWYIPEEKSAIYALAHLKVPMNKQDDPPKHRFQIVSDSPAGTIIWIAPDTFQAGLSLASDRARNTAITGISHSFAVLAERILDARGSKEKTRRLVIDTLQLQAGLKREPNLSRFADKSE